MENTTQTSEQNTSGSVKFNRPLRLIDWSEVHPQASARDIAIIQSTRCLCGHNKEIGKFSCGCR